MAARSHNCQSIKKIHLNIESLHQNTNNLMFRRNVVIIQKCSIHNITILISKRDGTNIHYNNNIVVKVKALQVQIRKQFLNGKAYLASLNRNTKKKSFNIKIKNILIDLMSQLIYFYKPFTMELLLFWHLLQGFL